MARWSTPIAAAALSTALAIAPALAPTAASASPAGAAAKGRLRVTQVQTDCCYTEGQVSFLRVRGPESLDRRFLAPALTVVALDADVAPGAYRLVSYQRPCDGNCHYLDAPTDRCAGRISVAAGRLTDVTITWAPGAGCQIHVGA